jgi:predicted site-specific integrase-resolvase
MREATPAATGAALYARILATERKAELTRLLQRRTDTSDGLVDDGKSIIASMATRLVGQRNAKWRAVHMQACITKHIEQADES